MILQRLSLAAGITLIAISLFGCKKDVKPPPPRVKKVVQVNVINTQYIELDDSSRYGMGENLYNRLISKLKENDHFVVIVDEPLAQNMSMVSKAINLQDSDRLKFDFAPFIVANFNADIKALTFSHGSKGAHRFAGFTRDFRTPWNNGLLDSSNEFPVRTTDLVNGWFGNAFAPQVDGSFDSIAGVTSGEAGEFNLIIAEVHYRRDKFVASTSLDTKLELLVDKETRQTQIDATGKGYLFALGVGWKQLMVEFGITRRTALKNTFDGAVEKIAEELQNQMSSVKFRTRIEYNGEQGLILNAGRREGMLVGDQFVVYRDGAVASRLKITETFHIGSVAVVIEGDTNLQPGEIVTIENEQVKPASTNISRSLAALTSATTKKSITIDPPEFSDPDGEEYASLKDSLSLPYLLWRWAQYDQDIHQDLTNTPASNIAEKSQSQWNLAQLGVGAAWNIARGHGATVAVIDSGVDYNHDNLGHAFGRNYAGFDFMSYDLRPFDDNSHGTAIAGLIAAKGIADAPVGVAPEAKLLSYKVFDPWGDTTSAALYGGMERAIQDGASIIIAAWDTRKPSQAIESIVALAEAHNVLLVVAAGDRGADLRNAPGFPAAFNNSPNVLVVGATNSTGALLQTPGHASNYGDGIVDIAAPGENLKVLSPRSEYLVRSGSDLAAAHAAGVAALVKSANAALGGKEIKAQLLATCTTNNALQGFITRSCMLNAAASLGVVH